MWLCLLCVEGSKEIFGIQAGWQNNFTFRGVHAHTCIYRCRYNTLLSLYTLKRRPPHPLQSTPNCWCFEPFRGCRLGHAAAIKRCLTATRPLGRMGGWKGCSKNRHHPHSREKGGVLCTLISKTNYISAMQSTALPPQPFPCTHCPGLLRT